MDKSVTHDKEGSNEEKMINHVQCRREVKEVLNCVASNGFGNVTLSNLYAGEIKKWEPRSHWGRRTTVSI